MTELQIEHIREERLRRERDWYTTEDGFLDFVRDSGAAPDAQFEPHGRLAPSLLRWSGEEDPESPGQIIYKYKMQLWPRGSFKSAVFNVGMCAWMIARNPNIRILVCSETGRQAREFVAKTMQIINSEWYKDRFGVHKGKSWKEGSGSFISALRTRTEIKEPTLQATGVGEVRTGMHWDFVLGDDVCSQENTRTMEGIETLWNWFGETLAQLDPGCKLMLIGTLHHYADIYCRIMKDPVKRALFELSIYGWSDPLIEPTSTEETKLFFPSRLTRRYVAQQKAIMPPRLYACFYENRPTTAEKQIFHPEYFHVIEEEDIPTNVWTYIFTDFAFIAEEKKKGRADRTCFWVVSLDCNRYAYVRDFYVGRWKPSDSIRIACSLWDRYQPINLKGIVVEESAHKEMLLSLFEEIRRQTFVHPKIITIAGRNQEVKDIRIEAIEPHFRAGEIYFARSVQQANRKWKPLIEEMTEWPYSDHDDIPDAISDLHKKDSKTNKFFCPAPSAGWRMATTAIHQPALIDGRYNPDAGYPARVFTKANQRGGNDIWRQGSSSGNEGPVSPSQSIFRRPQSPPMPLGKFS